MKNQNFKRGHRPQLSRHLVYIHQMPTTGSKASKTENEGPIQQSAKRRASSKARCEAHLLRQNLCFLTIEAGVRKLSIDHLIVGERKPK